MGGKYCNNFMFDSPIGESRFLIAQENSYAAHEDVAKFTKDEKNTQEALKPLQEVEAKRGNTMEEGVRLHGLPLWQQIKDVLYVDEKNRFILAIIRGDYDVNEIKLKHLSSTHSLRHATDDEIRNKLHSEPGFISPVDIKKIIEKDVKLIIVTD